MRRNSLALTTVLLLGVQGVVPSLTLPEDAETVTDVREDVYLDALA
jgi:hypothetical protein